MDKENWSYSFYGYADCDAIKRGTTRYKIYTSKWKEAFGKNVLRRALGCARIQLNKISKRSQAASRNCIESRELKILLVSRTS